MIRTIPLKIQNEYITGDKGMIGAAGSHNDVILRMEFSGMWDGLTKMVQFRDALGEATIEVLLTADMLEADDTSVYLVPVPNGAKKYAGEMTLCIKGAAVSAQKETRATLAVYGRFTVAESKFSALKEQSGTMNRVTNSGYVDTNVHQWVTGSANFICISCIYSIDGMTKPAWGYDSSQITVTFTNY